MGGFIRSSKAKVPVGQLFFFAGTTPPSGAIAADHSRVLISRYPELYAAIGNTWALPGDSTTDGRFRLPGGDGIFLRSGTPGTIAGANTVTLSASNLPDHTHKRNAAGSPEQILKSTGTGGNGTAPGGTSADATETNTGGVVGTTGQPFSIIPAHQTGLLCIWATNKKLGAIAPFWNLSLSHVNGALFDDDRSAQFAAGMNQYQQAYPLAHPSTGKRTMGIDLVDMPAVDYTTMSVYWINDAGQYAGIFASLNAARASIFERWLTLGGSDGGGIPGFADSGKPTGAGLRVFVDVDAGTWGAVAGNGTVFNGPSSLTPGTPGRFYCQLYPYYGGTPATGILRAKSDNYGAYVSI